MKVMNKVIDTTRCNLSSWERFFKINKVQGNKGLTSVYFFCLHGFEKTSSVSFIEHYYFRVYRYESS